MLFAIRFIKLFFMYNFRLENLKFKYLIDEITIDILSSWNVASMKDLRKKCN